MCAQVGSGYWHNSPRKDLEEYDGLSHRGIAQGLADIVRDAVPSLCIGLFGSYGSGKTTVLREANRRVPAGTQVRWAEFNAWEHDADSFRCELIRTLYEQTGVEMPQEHLNALARIIRKARERNQAGASK